MLNTISASYNIGGNIVNTISASIGVTIFPDDNVDADILLRHSDVAMYKSKNSGKNKFSFFDITADNKIKANYRALNKIKHAILNGDFSLYYQPKINSVTAQIIEVEALARWNHPLLGLLNPNEFLPLIGSDSELCDIFDNWVLEDAINQLVRWHKNGLYIKICINISPRHFKQKNFIETVKEHFVKNNVGLEMLSYIEFEILETDVVENLSRSNEIVKEFKKLGLTFALDDFGTGYSSLMHLKELNIDSIKIDKSFVSGMLDSSENMAIVQAVTALANAFDISVTAEGAQNIEQVISLMEIGCDEIQGYAIAKPMPSDEVVEFIRNFTPDPRWKIASHTLPSKADFELMVAEANHIYWVETVIEEFSKQNPDSSLVELNHASCRFGQWFEQNRNKNYKLTSSFKELDLLHKQIHTYVGDIYSKIKKDYRVINLDEIETLRVMSLNLTELLDKIRHEVEMIKKQQSIVNKILQKREQYAK